MKHLNGFVTNALQALIIQSQTYLIQKMREDPKPRISVFPFISGDLFLALADAAILRCQREAVILRNKKDILFVESGLLEVNSNLDYASNFTKIIVHNGDDILSQTSIERLVDRGRKVFATNVMDQSPNVFALPIGLENAYHNRNGNINYFNPLNMVSISLKKEKDILVSFNTSTNPPVRERIENVLLEAGYTNKKMSIIDYQKQLAKSRFVISPPGNGIDCHRTWEAFYHKTVPVIEKRYWLFEAHDLPILLVDNINDFICMSTNEKINLYESIINEKNYFAIYFDYWINFIHTTN